MVDLSYIVTMRVVRMCVLHWEALSTSGISASATTRVFFKVFLKYV